jgi:hypothetical protein
MSAEIMTPARMMILFRLAAICSSTVRKGKIDQKDAVQPFTFAVTAAALVTVLDRRIVGKDGHAGVPFDGRPVAGRDAADEAVSEGPGRRSIGRPEEPAPFVVQGDARDEGRYL